MAEHTISMNTVSAHLKYAQASLTSLKSLLHALHCVNKHEPDEDTTHHLLVSVEQEVDEVEERIAELDKIFEPLRISIVPEKAA